MMLSILTYSVKAFEKFGSKITCFGLGELRVKEQQHFPKAARNLLLLFHSHSFSAKGVVTFTIVLQTFMGQI